MWLCCPPKRILDKKHGPTWHCVVGYDFRSNVTFEKKTFAFFPIGMAGKQAVLLYKCDPS